MKIIVYILLMLIPSVIKAQLDMTFTDLSPYYLKETLIYTTKVTISNNTKSCKAISLTNRPDVTGIDSIHNDFSNLTQFVAEYGNTLIIEDIDNYHPSMYATWLKGINPGEKFTMIFISDRKMADSELASLIRVHKYMCALNGINVLGYNEDEIVIPLYDVLEKEKYYNDNN